MPIEHLNLEAGVTCVPYKMQVLRLLEAVCNRDHNMIREVHEGLGDHDSAALARDNEIGWRLLSRVVVASATGLMLRGT